MSFKSISTYIFLFSIFLFPSTVKAEFFEIQNFDVDIRVQENSEIRIIESIHVLFSSPRHGVFRKIPRYFYDDTGQKRSLKIKVKSIIDENGLKRPYRVSKKGDYLEAKIGDPDKFVEGEQVYLIEYQVSNGIKFSEKYDQLYWNVTGTEWPVKIYNSSAQIHFPVGEYEFNDQNCFTGTYGSTESGCKITFSRDNSIGFKSLKIFSPNEGLTISVGVPKGILKDVSFWKKILFFLMDNWGFGIPLFILFFLYFIFLKSGKDPKLDKVIIPFYSTPHKLSPAEVGTLYDERADIKDISSEIVFLAVNGHLKIKDLTTKGFLFSSHDYQFIRTPELAKSELKPYQEKLLESIFGTRKTKKLSTLKNRFYKDIPKINEMLYARLVKDKFFPISPEKVRKKYFSVGFIGCLAILYFWEVMILFLRLDIVAGIFISSIIIMIFSRFMPVKTLKGVETLWRIKGFRMYIDTAEKYRVKFQEKENIFEQFLPYAMIFGIAAKWSKAFGGIYKSTPEWYQGSHNRQFKMNSFIKSFNSMSKEMNNTLTSSPSSKGGGGRSGGGFGGGGGGSW